MLAARRPSWNFALDRAVDWARELKKPLIVLEALRSDYRWASDRFQQFVIDGMRDNAVAFGAMGIGYFPYVEPTPGAGRGLLASFSARAAVVVTDRAPIFDLPSLVAASARHVKTRYEAVDSNGLLPLDAPPTGVVFPSAYAFRRYLQRVLPSHLSKRPRPRPATDGQLPSPPALPAAIRRRWPAADLTTPSTTPVIVGGEGAARSRLKTFLSDGLENYNDRRNHPDDDAGTGLSPYLHFGQISTHEIVARLLRHENWKPDRLSHKAAGLKEGWWGLSASAEALLDQLVTWRELGLNMAARRADVDQFDSLPAWAIATLDAHAKDRRPFVYTLDQFAAADTHDELWNAAQRQLIREGRIHNYMRMLWGKKILEWSASPREALAIMIELNNRYAFDGRDPNSYSGIFWVLGRYDRPWPERPVFGTVRCMTSASTARKLRVKQYLARY